MKHESPIEIWLAETLGSNRKAFHARIDTQEGIGRYRADFVVRSSIAERAVVLECDGHRWHNSPEAIARDEQRDLAIIAAGYDAVLRIPGAVLMDDTLTLVTLAWFEPWMLCHRLRDLPAGFPNERLLGRRTSGIDYADYAYFIPKSEGTYVLQTERTVSEAVKLAWEAGEREGRESPAPARAHAIRYRTDNPITAEHMEQVEAAERVIDGFQKVADALSLCFGGAGDAA